MDSQSIFKRYEIKYLLTRQQKQRILQAMEPYMALDRYGHTTIRNIYFDTPNYRLIRRSLEKPIYKEKLRIRSYHRAKRNSRVFVELKKKYDGIVYKRRVAMEDGQAMAWLCGAGKAPQGQIAGEIAYFMTCYKQLHPVVFLSYEREAYYCRSGGDFRVTFDENILCRREDMDLEAPVWGTPLLEEDQVLMELKTSGGIPLWMTQALTRERLYKTSFSKYGTAYLKMIYPKGEYLYA